MNIRNLIAGSAAAILTVASGFAETPVNSPDSVLVGFRATADASVGANSFLFVGLNGLQAQSFAFNSQLVSQFGSDWYSNGNVRWGVYGVNASEDTDTDGNYYYGRTTVGTVGSIGLADGNWDYVVAASSVLDGIKGNLAANVLLETTAGYSYGVLSGPDANSALGLASAFQGLIGSIASYPGEFDLSQVQSLNVNRILPNADFDGFGTQTVAGTLSVGSDGTIALVPEPSTYALLGVSALIGLVAIRRSKKA
jgi:hypothetical protein